MRAPRKARSRWARSRLRRASRASRARGGHRGMWQNAPVLRCAKIGIRQLASRSHSMRIRLLILTLARGAPRTLSVGQRTPEGVLLVSVDSSAAVVEVEGKRERLEMGQHFENAAQS